MDMSKAITFVLVLASLQIIQCHGLVLEDSGPSRIMLLPMPGENHTHISSFSHIADELIDHGHDVFLLIPQDYPDLDQLRKRGIKPLVFGAGSSRSYREYGRDYHGIEAARIGIPYDEYVQRQVPFYKMHCSAALGDPDLHQKLRRINFDLAIVDANPLSRCLYVIPYRLGVPFVSVAKQIEPTLQGLPFMPSVNPFVFGSDFTEQMSFSQRFSNLWSFMSWTSDPKVDMLKEDYLSRFIPEKAVKHADDIAKDSLLWLIESDSLLDYPSPRMPNMIDVGGLTTRKASQIPSDIGKFMDDAKDGVILVDLGLHSDNMPYDVMEKLTSGLIQTRYNIVWNHAGERPSRLSSKLRFVEELPRNDLLGHINTRLYISDGDHNGQFESMYHGVPSIIFPVHGGHSYAANRAVYRGFGLRLDMENFTPNQLTETIEDVTKNHSFTENIQRASKIFKSRKQFPREKAAEWIEHVLQYGGDYMKTYGLKMGWRSFYLVDVVALCFIGVVTACIVVYKVLKCIFRRLCCGRRKHNVCDCDDMDDDYDGMYEVDHKGRRGSSSQEAQKSRGGYRGANKPKRH